MVAVQVVDEVEERSGPPVDVLEDHDDRLLARERLEQPAKGPEAFAAVERGRIAQPLRDPTRVLLPREHRVEIAHPTHDLEEREQRNALP